MPRALLLALAAAAAACHSDPFFDHTLPETPAGDGTMRMSARIDGRTYVASDPDGFSEPHIEVNKGGIHLSAAFTRASPNDPSVTAASHILTVAGSAAGDPLPARVEFTRTDAFSGTLYWIAPGQAVTLWLGLYDVPGERHVFGPFSVVIERRSHAGGGAEL